MASIAESLTSLLKEQGILLTDLNPLYFLPAVAVIVCCLVYAFGFKSSSNTLPPSSLALLRDEPKNKQKIKANGVTTTNKNKTHGVSNGSVAKPKAVVKPVKRQEVKSPKATSAIPAPVKNLADNDEVEDLNSGDWVTVVSDKAKKEKKKQQKQTEERSPSSEGTKKEKKDQKDKKDKKNQDKNKQEKVDKKETIRTRSVAKQEKTEVEEPVKKPTVISLDSLKPEDFENWSIEEPVEGKVQVSKKSLNKNSNKEQNKVQGKLMERKMSRDEQKSKNDSVAEDLPVIKEDKITKDILTQYDAPVAKKEPAKKKTDAKKKSADEGNKQQQPPVVSEATKKTNAKKEPKKEVKKDTSSGDNKKEQKKKQETVAQKTLVPEEPVAPKTPSTDVTDGKNIMIFQCSS